MSKFCKAYEIENLLLDFDSKRNLLIEMGKLIVNLSVNKWKKISLTNT